MGAARRNRVTGYLLLAFAAAWVAAVWYTVPPGTSGLAGPRTFPLGLGFLLGGLALVLLVGSYFKPAGMAAEADEEYEIESEALAGGWLYPRLALSLFLVFIAYGFLMEKIGFVLATLLIVVVMMAVILKIRNPVTIISMAVGLAFGCWLMFGKILGAYLPPGTWISLF